MGNVDVIRGIYDAFAKGDVPGVLGAMDEKMQFAHVWGVRDGKVVRFQQYTDTGQFLKATGA